MSTPAVDTVPRISSAVLEPSLAARIVDALPDAVVVTDGAGLITSANRQVSQLFGYEPAELIGRSVDELVPPELRSAHARHRADFAGAPRLRPMGGTLDLWARRRDGADFPVEVALSPIEIDGDHQVIATIRDVSARRALDQIRRDLDHCLDGITDAVCLADPDTWQLAYRNEAAAQLLGCDVAHRPDTATLDALLALEPDRPAALVAELRADPQRSVHFRTTLQRPDGTEVPVECEIDLPTPLRGQPPRIVAIVRDITAQLQREAIARAAHELLAINDERERLARDLHDTVIQEVFAAGLTLQGIALRAPAELRPRIEQVIDHHDDVIRHIRTTIFGLASRHGAEGGLRDQVAAVVAEASRILGFTPVLRISGLLDVATPAAVAEELVPTLREALSNVARHAQATRVEVDLDQSDATLTLRVADNGRGLPDRQAASSGGNGLRNLAERARRLGGSMTLDAPRSGGTRLTWTVPSG